ncbi:3-hydroxyacyl-CoA dehydrogenase, partial [Phenoliferia sp. Uapishka_3]
MFSRAVPRLSLLQKTLAQQSAPRYFSSSIAMQEIKTVTVFGAGLMGAGIVQVAAHNGVKVIMTDVSDAALENGLAIITKSLTRIAKKLHPDSSSDQASLLSSTFANITTTTSAQEAVSNTDLVIEAIVENLAVKQELFKKLDGMAKKETIFASNTSSLSVKSIGELCSAERQERFAGFHAFNPVPQMKLVEIVQTDKTSDETRDSLLELCKVMKKTSVNCKDTPGFIVNRLLVPYMLEAIRMVERGDASAADVDTAMKLGAGLPMGPLELSDVRLSFSTFHPLTLTELTKNARQFVGLDTLSAIARGWRDERVATGEIDAKAVEQVESLERLVAEGKKGRKSGMGFFDYAKK